MPKKGCSNVGKYPNVPRNLFCGPAGGACEGSYPVNTPQRARAALAYAHYAPYPEGIRRCVQEISHEKGWAEPGSKVVHMKGRTYDVKTKGGKVYVIPRE